ncbi:hypothetical protein OSB04_031632 [Centaurea solstitialis]|uniref:Polyprotein n=1 Tax=Centaurea solstitialis TaxID=347529 RepID=A0AA38SB43_9ASTR|nr:hypothetical protein OSB04_031632 [Centaurea solstitialis]
MVEIKTEIESHSGGDRLFYRTAAVVAVVAAVVGSSLIEPSIDGGCRERPNAAVVVTIVTVAVVLIVDRHTTDCGGGGVCFSIRGHDHHTIVCGGDGDGVVVLVAVVDNHRNGVSTTMMSFSVIPFYTPEESLRLINGKWKLTGQNFQVWKMHLDNILRAQGKFYVLDKPVSRPKSNSPEEEFTQYFKYMADESDVMSILIFSISSEFTDRLRDKSCHEVVKDIEGQLGFYRHTGKLLIMKEMLSLKMKKDQSVKDHLMEMRRLFKCLTRLGYKMTQEELMYLMWYSLPKEICDTTSAYMKEPKTDVAALHENILASLEPKPAPANLMDTDWIDELGDLSCPECGSKDICEHSMNIDQIEIGLPDAPGIFMIDCLITSYESWVIDTGSGNHICNHLQGFTRRKTLRKDRSNLRVGEGTPLIAEAVGSYSLSLPSGLVLELDNCYYIPNMIKNVLSFDLLVDQGFYYKYDYKMIYVFKNNIFYFKETPVNGLYTVNLQDNSSEIYHISKRSKDIEDQTYLWHCRLGHINKKRVELLLKGGFLGTLNYKPFDNCKSCLSGKMTKQPFNKENERATDLLEIVHTDVCGPFSHVARGGYRYFITFTDDFSRYGYVYLMRHKSESFERFEEFQNEVQNQLGRKIKFLRSDRGGEYLSDEFDNHLMECGIVSQLTPPYTPQMNGVSERRNRTLLDMGCEVYVKRLTSEKLKPKSDKCFFVGYPRTSVGYYFYNPEENKVFVARNEKFLEEKFLSSGNTRKDVDLQEVDEENTTPIVEPEIQHENVEPQSEAIEKVQTQDLRRSSRVRQEPDRYLGFLVSQDGGDLNEPTSYGEAVSGNESEQWQEAMKAEMQSMYNNQVWELTDLPQHCRAVGRKWVFKKKTDMDGNVHTFKARLVAKGFTQTHGIDYDETFSPMAMLKSIRILMAISAYFNYEIWQMDVKTAFLNGKLTEDVYMEQPEGFEDPKNPNKMASTVTSTNNLSLRSILEKDKLTGSNFLDWERNLMIVLRHERKWYVLEKPLGEAPPANAPAAARNAHKKHSDDLLDVAYLMLATMSPDLQAGLINTNAYDMIRQLRDMFQTQARTERYDATKAFNECKMVKGTSVSDHVMKMKRHLDHLERLGHPVPLQLATDTILNSLSEDYRPFVVNYNMNNMEKIIAELHSMLKTAELNMGKKNKTKDVLMVKDGGVKKKNGQASTSKGKGPVQAIQSAPKKGKGNGKGKKVKPNKARTENRCFICNEIGHWRQNCPKRHEAGRNRSSTQQLRKVAVLHIQELEVRPGSYDQLLNNSYKCCRLKVAQIFDRVANIGRDPRLRLLLGISHKVAIKGATRFSGSRGVKGRYARWDLHLFSEERYFWAHLD